MRLVSTSGPSSVTATVCSKCAARLPSWVTAVQPSSRIRTSQLPIVTIGSMASLVVASESCAYEASKGGVAQLTKALPRDLAAAQPRWPRLQSKITATGQMWQLRDAYGGRIAVIAGFTYPGGVDPSVFRTFAARPTGASNALWEGVASGGIAVSYTMGKLDKLTLGGTVTATGRTTKRLRVVAFGTMGIRDYDGAPKPGHLELWNAARER